MDLSLENTWAEYSPPLIGQIAVHRQGRVYEVFVVTKEPVTIDQAFSPYILSPGGTKFPVHNSTNIIKSS